jgi:hypothetical protein
MNQAELSNQTKHAVNIFGIVAAVLVLVFFGLNFVTGLIFGFLATSSLTYFLIVSKKKKARALFESMRNVRSTDGPHIDMVEVEDGKA